MLNVDPKVEEDTSILLWEFGTVRITSWLLENGWSLIKIDWVSIALV